MKLQLRWLALAALPFSVSGCALFGIQPVTEGSMPEKYLLQPGARTPADVPVGHSEVIEPVLPNLYGRDGSPVSAQPAGSVTRGQTTHDIENTEGSRMYILELYQQAIEDKEGFALEVDALRASLEQIQDLLEQSEMRVTELQDMVKKQQEGMTRLERENVELAGRLTTAQIRRLESEKLLLEAKLEWQRLQRVIESANDDRSSDLGVERP